MSSIRNDITVVKKINTELIKNVLKSRGQATKADIAKDTNISIATCGKILNELCQTGEVLEAAIVHASYGRPSTSYTYNANFALVGCLYILTDQGKRMLATVVADLLGNIIEESIRETRIADYDLINTEIKQLLKDYPNIHAFAVGIPGYMTNNRIEACNVAELTDLDLYSDLQRDFPGIKFIVEKGSNAVAYGYHAANNIDKKTPVACLYSPIDVYRKIPASDKIEENNLLDPIMIIGGGFVSNNQILRGYSGFSGEWWCYVKNDPLYASEKNVSPALIGNFIIAIVTILNPGIVILAGGFFNYERFCAVQKYCEAAIPKQHLPKFHLIEDIHRDYINGLIALAQEQLNYEIQLTRKLI